MCETEGTTRHGKRGIRFESLRDEMLQFPWTHVCQEVSYGAKAAIQVLWYKQHVSRSYLLTALRGRERDAGVVMAQWALNRIDGYQITFSNL